MSDKGERTFLDTNVFVYAHDPSTGRKYERAQDLIGSFWKSGTGCLSIQVMQEFYVTVTRKMPEPLEPGEASSIVGNLATWDVHRPQPADIVEAIGIQQRYTLSFWDAMIIQSALQLECTTLLTEDLNDGQVFGPLTVRNPFAVS